MPSLAYTWAMRALVVPAEISGASRKYEVLGVDGEPIPHLYSAGKVVEANSTDIDGVTGATITSKAFLAAVQDAIAKA